MRIMREWRGVIRRSHREEYVAYIESTGLARYRAVDGNRGAVVAVRDLDEDRTEVVTLSWWDSFDSIRGFAGIDIDLARYYPLPRSFGNHSALLLWTRQCPRGDQLTGLRDQLIVTA